MCRKNDDKVIGMENSKYEQQIITFTRTRKMFRTSTVSKVHISLGNKCLYLEWEENDLTSPGHIMEK